MSDEPVQFRPVDRSAHELLIVDDDPVSRYTTGRLLRAAGFRTREAANGAEGLRLADDGISAMVLDVHLPDIDGFELCRRLRSAPKTARLPVLHLSAAYVEDKDKVRGLDSGADAYLTHPVEPAVLVATVQALVRARSAEDAMRRSEARFRTIYARANSGICLLDSDGRFVDANPAMLELLGRNLEQVAGLPVSCFVPATWTDRVAAFLRDGATDRKEQFPIERADGSAAHLEWNLSSDFEPGVSMAVVTDVSQRVELEEQRRQALDREREARGAAEHLSRMKDEFIAVLSHELRTPLNAIMGWAYVLKKRENTEETQRGLHAIERNGKLQARLIADLMDMSRLNLGKMRLEFENVAPVEVVNTAIGALQPVAEEHDITIVHQVPAPPPRIRADAARLEQIIWNLLSNAIKFSPRGGQVTVTTEARDDGIAITVADNGQGISSEFLPYLFDRFTQADAASNRFRGGLGLGLSIVQHLVHAHGGSVVARSPGVGQGTVFDVWLPISGLQEGLPDTPADPIDSGNPSESAGATDPTLDGLHVLVVDDDREACEMLQIVLTDRGACVSIAHDSDSALVRLSEGAIDVVISDVGMPERDGYSLVREMRKRELGDRHLPVIALTSFSRPQDRELALTAGFDAHCAKPLRPFQLIQQIEQLTDRNRQDPRSR